MNKSESVLWKFFYFLILIILVKFIGNFFGVQLESKYPWFKFILLGIPVMLLIVHSLTTLSKFRSAFFILLAATIGTLMEYIGLKYGTFFGGNYIYETQLTLFTVPVLIICYWAIFIYMGYCLTNSFIYWLKKEKPNYQNKRIFLLILSILFDGYFVTAIDLFMDPISVQFGNWTWLGGGPYFGIPIGNFIGWFFVTIIVVSIFRIFEYFYPKKEMFNKSIFIIPVLEYGVIAISFFLLALNFDKALAMVGLLFMLPQTIISLIMFRRFKINKNP